MSLLHSWVACRFLFKKYFQKYYLIYSQIYEIEIIQKYLRETIMQFFLPILKKLKRQTFLWFRHMVHGFDVAAELMIVGILLRTLWSIDRSIKRDYICLEANSLKCW